MSSRRAYPPALHPEDRHILASVLMYARLRVITAAKAPAMCCSPRQKMLRRAISTTSLNTLFHVPHHPQKSQPISEPLRAALTQLHLNRLLFRNTHR
jgi:hypothetical protein